MGEPRVRVYRSDLNGPVAFYLDGHSFTALVVSSSIVPSSSAPLA